MNAAETEGGLLSAYPIFKKKDGPK